MSIVLRLHSSRRMACRTEVMWVGGEERYDELDRLHANRTEQLAKSIVIALLDAFCFRSADPPGATVIVSLPPRHLRLPCRQDSSLAAFALNGESKGPIVDIHLQGESRG